MTVNPVVIHPEVSCFDAFHILLEKGFDRLPVVGQDGSLVGIVTKKDLLGGLRGMPTSPGSFEKDSIQHEMAVDHVMNGHVITVHEDCPLETAARIMMDNKIGGLPVIRGSRVVGMITRTDILGAMAEALGWGSKGLRITIRLREDNGELGAIADGILQLGGRLVSLSTFWGSNRCCPRLTLKVHGIYVDEMRMMLENFIGVEVMEIVESSSDYRPDGIPPATAIGVPPMLNPNVRDV
jgi:acetoin utilization protein AcuB